MIHFSFNIGFSESKVIFKRRKKANMSNKNALQGANFRTSCTSLRTLATNKHSQHIEYGSLTEDKDKAGSAKVINLGV